MDRDNFEVINLDEEILTLLEENGFSREEIGTFFYKEVIKIVSLYLSTYTNEEERERQKKNLQTQLLSKWSIFYFQIATNLYNFNCPDFDKLNDAGKFLRFNEEIKKSFKKSVFVTKFNANPECYTSFISFFSNFVLNLLEHNEESFKNDGSNKKLMRTSGK